MPARLNGPGPKNGRGWGNAGVRRKFTGEDWRAFNRLSLWIYPDCPGWHVVALELRLYNDGMEKLPAPFGQEGETTVVLETTNGTMSSGRSTTCSGPSDRLRDLRLDVRP